MTRHWYGEDGAHIWSSHTISGAEGAWSGDISCVGEYFQPKGPILKGLIRGQYPSHWVATKRSDREVDVHGLVTLMVEGGGTYTAHVHEYIKFWEPCVTINRHFWKLEYLEAEYHPTHWYHKEKAVIDPNWNWGPSKEKMTFSWHLFGNLGNRAIEADGYGYGSGYRQHHWGKGGKPGQSMDILTSTGLSPGKDMPACTFSRVSPRASPTPSFCLFPRDSPSNVIGGDRTALIGPPPTISDSKAPTSTRRSCSLVMDSRETASCGGMATKRKAPGS